jgi:hypothetical protein
MAKLTDQYNPQFATLETGPKPPQLAPAPPFMLKHHPERWGVQHGRVLPVFAKLHLQAGISRVEQVGGQFVMGEAIAQTERRGWKVIPMDVQGEGTSYLRKPEGTNTHLMQWEIAYPGSRQRGLDVEGWIKFIDLLIKKGAIERPALYVLERMLADKQKTYGAAADQAVTMPSAKSRADSIAADIKVIEAEINKAKKKTKPTKSKPVTLGDLKK